MTASRVRGPVTRFAPKATGSGNARTSWRFGSRFGAGALLACTAVTLTGPASAAPPFASPARLIAPTAAASQFHRVAVFGRDDRRSLSGRTKALSNKIGVLTHSDTKAVCTAFCVSREVVATAGHCVVGTLNQPATKPWQLRFRLDASSASVAIAGAATRSVSDHIVTGAHRLNTRPPINATSDWALLRLSSPACSEGGLPISTQSAAMISANAALGHVYHVAYHRDLAHWKLSIARACTMVSRKKSGDPEQLAKDFDKPGDLLLHTCDTEAASSGSPLLMDGDNGPEVVGINVGTYVRSRVITHDGHVVQRLASEVVGNTALVAASLAAHVNELAQADTLKRNDDIRRLQKKLAEAGVYSGAVDGILGPKTRDAIEAYESRMKWPIKGLATRQLLDRMDAFQATTAAR